MANYALRIVDRNPVLFKITPFYDQLVHFKCYSLDETFTTRIEPTPRSQLKVHPLQVIKFTVRLIRVAPDIQMSTTRINAIFTLVLIQLLATFLGLLQVWDVN